MSDKKFDLEDRLVDFAANAVFLCKTLPNDWTGQYYGKQLLRSAGSSALNFGEATGAQTIKDQANKYAICLKELKESRINLKVLHRVKYGDNEKVNGLLDEVEQLVKIIATIIKNKRS